jgi:hypothetical protein
MKVETLGLFDPQKLAHYEMENYVSYYQRHWLKLLSASVGMVKEAYHYSVFQAVYGAYLIARAEMAFAPFPENNLPLTEAYIRRFYLFLKRVHRLDFDIDQVVKLELNWWIVHRNLFAQEENQGLVEALERELVVLYGLDAARAHPVAAERARGMYYSDQWVRSGRDPASPLLQKEEEALCEGYRLLKAAVASI